ncbi:MAG: AzlC family ABC transporter permease [Paracoccaceae bacterium]
MPLQLATLPFGLIFGVVAIETGLDPGQIFAITVIVVAGASSLVAMELIQDQVPALLVILTSALVNLRMAMYSAALVPHWTGAGWKPRLAAGYFLNDQTYAISVRAYEAGQMPDLRERVAYFFGSGCCCIPVWTATVYLGVLLGQQVPQSWGLEMAAPALFLAIAAPMVRTPAHGAAFVVSMGVMAFLPGLPQGLDIVVASMAGIAAGMTVARFSA